MACVGQYRKLAACIFYNTPILGLLSVTFQAGVPYNALTWLVWVSTDSWLRVFRIIHLFCGRLVFFPPPTFSIMLSHGLCRSVQSISPVCSVTYTYFVVS